MLGKAIAVAWLCVAFRVDARQNTARHAHKAEQYPGILHLRRRSEPQEGHPAEKPADTEGNRAEKPAGGDVDEGLLLEVKKAENDLRANLDRQADIKAELMQLSNETASNDEISNSVRAVSDETASPALGQFLGSMWSEMRLYATPFYEERLMERLTELRERQVVLEQDLGSARKALAARVAGDSSSVGPRVLESRAEREDEEALRRRRYGVIEPFGETGKGSDSPEAFEGETAEPEEAHDPVRKRSTMVPEHDDEQEEARSHDAAESTDSADSEDHKESVSEDAPHGESKSRLAMEGNRPYGAPSVEEANDSEDDE